MNDALAFADADDGEESITATRAPRKKTDGEVPATYVPRSATEEVQLKRFNDHSFVQKAFTRLHGATEVREVAEWLYYRGRYHDVIRLVDEFRLFNSQRRKAWPSRDLDDLATRAQIRLGNWSEALAHMERMTNLENEPGVLLLSGTIYGKVGKYGDALSAFQQYSDSRNDYLVWLRMSEVVELWGDFLNASNINPSSEPSTEQRHQESVKQSLNEILVLSAVSARETASVDASAIAHPITAPAPSPTITKLHSLSLALHQCGERLLQHSLSSELPAGSASSFRARHQATEIVQMEKRRECLGLKVGSADKLPQLREAVITELQEGWELSRIIGRERTTWFTRSILCDTRWWNAEHGKESDEADEAGDEKGVNEQ
ncbi:hypothetical protein HDU93_006622 [Gonapodya sp. JEL0774]|nr:hypothetical protein HDU93_006622 [Gonapodya sp. JEL0774]